MDVHACYIIYVAIASYSTLNHHVTMCCLFTGRYNTVHNSGTANLLIEQLRLDTDIIPSKLLFKLHTDIILIIPSI